MPYEVEAMARKAGRESQLDENKQMASPTMSPLREAQYEVDQQMERLAMLAEKLIARIDPILLPQTTSAMPREGSDPTAPASEIAQWTRSHRMLLAHLTSSIEDTLDRIDL